MILKNLVTVYRENKVLLLSLLRWCEVNGRIFRIYCLALVHLHISRYLPLHSLPSIWDKGWRENCHSLSPPLHSCWYVIGLAFAIHRGPIHGVPGRRSGLGKERVSWVQRSWIWGWLVTVRNKSLATSLPFPVTFRFHQIHRELVPGKEHPSLWGYRWTFLLVLFLVR